MHYKFIKKYYFIEKFEKSNIDKQAANTTIIYRNYNVNYKMEDIIARRAINSKKPDSKTTEVIIYN